MKTIVTAAAFAVALFVVPASAQPAHADMKTQAISYADLDLGTEAGVKALDQRIRAAVKAACGIASDADLEGQNELRRCRAEATARAELQRSQAMASARQAGPAMLAAQP